MLRARLNTDGRPIDPIILNGSCRQIPLQLHVGMDAEHDGSGDQDREAIKLESTMQDSPFSDRETQIVIDTLNNILEMELAGVVRYMHYSFMVFGHNRIPIVSWLLGQADESRMHAIKAGEHVTTLGGHPSLKIGQLLETHRHDVGEILQESYEHEHLGLAEYRKLLILGAGKSILLEEYARQQIAAEEEHLATISKMMRKPASIK